MSDQPKVSERMRQLFKSATKEAFGNGNMFAFPEEEHIPQCSAGDALFSAIAEIEQRAEIGDKWKEAAVAFHNANLAHADLELWITVPENIKNQPESFGEAVERAYVANCAVGRSIAALGDEWDEATR